MAKIPDNKFEVPLLLFSWALTGEVISRHMFSMHSTQHLYRVLVVGWGAFGSAIGGALAERSDILLGVLSTRSNLSHLPSTVRQVGEGELAEWSPNAIVLCVPSKAVRSTMDRLASISHLVPIISCVKGMDEQGRQLISQLIYQLTSNDRIAVLVGPSFATDIQAGRRVRLSLACENVQLAIDLSSRISTPRLCIDPVPDIRTLEIAAVAKNIIAFGAGLIEGLGYGESFKATYIALGIRELAELVRLCGGHVQSLYQVGSLGDIILTATSSTSRNYQTGLSVASGIDSGLLSEGLLSGQSFLDYINGMGVHSLYFERIIASRENPSSISDVMELIR